MNKKRIFVVAGSVECGNLIDVVVEEGKDSEDAFMRAYSKTVECNNGEAIFDVVPILPNLIKKIHEHKDDLLITEDDFEVENVEEPKTVEATEICILGKLTIIVNGIENILTLNKPVAFDLSNVSVSTFAGMIKIRLWDKRKLIVRQYPVISGYKIEEC